MNYYGKANNLEANEYSPVDFRKSTVKGAYYSSSMRDPEIEELKERYGVKSYRNRDKYLESYSNFDEIRKVPEELSNLRATFNAGSKQYRVQNFDRFDKEDNFLGDRLQRSPYKPNRDKPEMNLRHTLYSKKTEDDYDCLHPNDSVSSSFTIPYRKGSDYDGYKYDIKVNQPSQVSTVLSSAQLEKDRAKAPKIDFDMINEKIKSNAAMIDQLRRLKRQRKTRHQNKLQKSDVKDYNLLNPTAGTQDRLNVSEKKRYTTKSYEIEAYTPKYEKKTVNIQQGLTKKAATQVLERSKSNYLSAENTKSAVNEYKVEKNMAAVKSSKDLFPKDATIAVGDFILGKTLGEGKFGTVFKAIHKPTQSIYAIKKVPKIMIKQHNLVDQFILELKIQSFFNHRNVLKIFGFFDDHDSIYLILEYMEQGTLFTYFKKNKKLTQDDAARKIRDVSEAIQCLHENGVAHRDIKPENIVMSYGVCKLCDFGWATICNQRRKTYCGTFDYAAPQILEGVEYDMSVDEWCIGILAYELMIGKAPFYHISRKQTMKKIMNAGNTPLHYPEGTSKNVTSFIDKLIIKNPDERMKADEILEHPFLNIEEIPLN